MSRRREKRFDALEARIYAERIKNELRLYATTGNDGDKVLSAALYAKVHNFLRLYWYYGDQNTAELIGPRDPGGPLKSVEHVGEEFYLEPGDPDVPRTGADD